MIDEPKAGKGKPIPQPLIVAAELELMQSAGIAEVACRNQNVMDYMRHWEGRTEKAESALTEAQATIARLGAALKQIEEQDDAGDMMYHALGPFAKIARAALSPGKGG